MKILQGIWLIFRYWRLILSFRSMPPLPANWRDMEQVREFFIAFIKSDLINELTKLTPTKWDDNARRMLLALAEQQRIWAIAWNVLHFEEKTIQRPTLRERIRERWSMMGTSAISESRVDEVECLTDAIRAIETAFGE